LVDEVDGRLDRTVVGELQDTEAGRFIDGGELVAAPLLEAEMLHVDLDRLPWDTDVATTEGTGPVALLGYTGDVVLLQDSVNRGGRDVDLVVPVEAQAQSDDPILALLTETEDQGLDVGWGTPRADLRAAFPIAQSLAPGLPVAGMPVVELTARDPKDAAGPADVPGDLLEVLDEAAADLHPSRLLGRRSWWWPSRSPLPEVSAFETSADRESG
jgi:hypothetical protein